MSGSSFRLTRWGVWGRQGHSHPGAQQPPQPHHGAPSSCSCLNLTQRGQNEGWTPTLHLSTLPCFPLPRTEVWAAFPWLFGKIPVVSRPSMELGAVQEVYRR